MRAATFLALLSGVTTVLAGNVVQLYESGDTYSWFNVKKDVSKPSPQEQAAYAKVAYEDMKDEAADKGFSVPSTMSVAFWEKAGSIKGTLILHSSTKNRRGNAANPDNAQYINDCNIGQHRYKGACAEIGNIVYANYLASTREITHNKKVTWTVYGIKNDDGAMDWILPCSDKDGTTGCSTYVKQLADQAGGGGQCIAKREPDPKGGKKTTKAGSKPSKTNGNSPKTSAKASPTKPVKSEKTPQATGAPTISKPSGMTTVVKSSAKSSQAISSKVSSASFSSAIACARPTGVPMKYPKPTVRVPNVAPLPQAPKPTIKAKDLPPLKGNGASQTSKQAVPAKPTKV